MKQFKIVVEKHTDGYVAYPLGITPSSGNVFADLGLPKPEERLLKAELAFQIKALLDADGLAPPAAVLRLGITPQALEDLRLGRLAGTTVNELLEYVKRLGCHVQIQVAA